MVRPAFKGCLFLALFVVCLGTFIATIAVPLSIRRSYQGSPPTHDNDNKDEDENIIIPEPDNNDNITPEPPTNPYDPRQENIEVWLIDQSDTFSSKGNDILDSGGTIYVYKNQTLIQEIDIGEMAEWIYEETGAYPVRPHYVDFNICNTHAIISFVSSGHVLVMSVHDYTPTYVVKVGEQAHTAITMPNSGYILVTNQNGKKLHRIKADFQNNNFEHEEDATIDFDKVFENDARFPDNAPILAIPSHNEAFGFVTLRGGGFLVVNIQETPMTIEEGFGNDLIEPNGLFAVEHDGKVYFNSGGGGGDTSGFYGYGYQNMLYVYDQTTRANPELVFKIGGKTDGHGMVMIGDYLWITDITDDNIIVFNTKNGKIRNNLRLPNNAAPDLITHVDGYVYISYKGPKPLTGNNPDFNNAVGAIPGMGIMKVLENGASGEYIETVRIYHAVDGEEHADAHAIGARNTEASLFSVISC